MEPKHHVISLAEMREYLRRTRPECSAYAPPKRERKSDWYLDFDMPDVNRKQEVQAGPSSDSGNHRRKAGRLIAANGIAVVAPPSLDTKAWAD